MLRSLNFSESFCAGGHAPDAMMQGQHILSHYNRDRLAPGLGEAATDGTNTDEQAALALERDFVTAARAKIAPLLADVPADPDAFIAWFEDLRQTGPGQSDP